MSYDRLLSALSNPASELAVGALAPGKRSLTQSLPPKAPSLRDDRRAVVDFDDGVEDHFYDSRATVDVEPTQLLLNNRQLRKARRRNPRWVRQLRVSAQIFSTADPSSDAFALDVAEKQLARRLVVDGIAGPKTVAAVAAETSARRSTRRPERDSGERRELVDFDEGVGQGFYDERATVARSDQADRFADDDPFGMHLLAND
jgi:hypothetical protein